VLSSSTARVVIGAGSLAEMASRDDEIRPTKT